MRNLVVANCGRTGMELLNALSCVKITLRLVEERYVKHTAETSLSIR